jgi:hypothetical protein
LALQICYTTRGLLWGRAQLIFNQAGSTSQTPMPRRIKINYLVMGAAEKTVSLLTVLTNYRS